MVFFNSDLLWDMISRYLTIFVKHSNISNINWKVLPLKNACKRNSVKDRLNKMQTKQNNRNQIKTKKYSIPKKKKLKKNNKEKTQF